MTNEEKLPSDEEMEDLPEPDTDTGGEGQEALEAIPVAEPTAPAPPTAEPAPAPGGPPRVFPQQYTMLFANVCIFAGTLTIWERAHVTGQPAMPGYQMIGGALVCAFSLYCVLTGVVSLLRGGVRFGSTLLSGFFALYFAIKSMVRVMRLDTFLYYGDFKAAPHNLTTQEAVEAFLGQFGPGHYLCLFGGFVIIVMFLKAMFGGKKKEPAPAPARRRR